LLVPSWLHRAPRHAALLDRARRAAVPCEPGERVAIAVPPGPDFEVLLHAIWLRGGVAVPHDLRLTPGERPPADRVLVGLELGEPAGVRDRLDLAAPALGLQTSGSTGTPKPVTLTFGNLLWSALGSAVALGVQPEDRWLSALPLSHVGGLSILARSAIYGTEAVVHERFEADRVLHGLRHERITAISLVPTTLARLLDAGLHEPPHLRFALLGGAPIPPVLLERAREARVPVVATYGLTEAASQVTTDGWPLFCTRVTLDADGEILVSGPTVARDAKKGTGTSVALRTGDLGRWEPDGRLAVVGRKADTIVSGGENVAPAEVEAVLEAHPAVAEALVRGRPDPEWGEAVEAVVVLRDGMHASEQELQAWCAARLARFKVPKAVSRTGRLPRTASGKLVRSATSSGTEG
jgi:O-succinylbenzoic acid--CoA ligase